MDNIVLYFLALVETAFPLCALTSMDKTGRNRLMTLMPIIFYSNIYTEAENMYEMLRSTYEMSECVTFF